MQCRHINSIIINYLVIILSVNLLYSYLKWPTQPLSQTLFSIWKWAEFSSELHEVMKLAGEWWPEHTPERRSNQVKLKKKTPVWVNIGVLKYHFVAVVLETFGDVSLHVVWVFQLTDSNTLLTNSKTHANWS